MKRRKRENGLLPRGLAACATAMAVSFTASASLTFHCTFDETGDPLSPVCGTGTPVVVKYATATGISAVDGLGGCALVTNETILAGLRPDSNALTIPVGQALRIPHGVPTDTDRPWAMAVRFYLPDDGLKYHTIFSNHEDKPIDASLFVKYDTFDNTWGKEIRMGGGNDSSKGWGYDHAAALTPGWHVIALSLQDGHQRLYIDRKLVYDRPNTVAAGYDKRLTLKNHPYIFLSADEAAEDNPMHFDWVKIWDEAEPADLLGTRDPVGLWEFPEDNPTHASVGADLELVATVSGKTVSSSSVTGLVPGDGAMRLNQYTAYKVRHCLRNQPYTVVIDAKMPSGVYRPNNYHALWHENGAMHTTSEKKIPDPTIALRSNDTESPKRVRFWGQSGQDDLVIANGRYVYEDEWVRYVITWDGTTRSFYANGALVFASTRPSALDTEYSYLHGDLDGQGEESPLDFTTLALYEGAFDAEEVARLGRPVGTPSTGGDSFDALPAGEWVLGEKTVQGVPSRHGEDLAAVESGYEWRHATANGGALSNLTYVLDLDVTTGFAAGAILETPSGKAIRLDAEGRIGNDDIGWSDAALSSGLHRLVIANTGASGTDILVNGALVTKGAFGKFADAAGGTAETQVFRLLEPSGVTLTYAAVYAGAVWPVATQIPLDFDPSVAGSKAQPAIGEVTVSPTGLLAGETLTATLPCKDAARGWYATEIDFGDGTRLTSGWLQYADAAYGGSASFTHAYAALGSYDVKVRAYDAQHRVSAWQTAATVAVRSERKSDDILSTWPWQQNVYTNRFTVMCETKIQVEGLELQWGTDFANTTAMTGVQGNGGTWLYTARVAVADAAGETIAYRLAVSGQALAGRSTTGAVRLWPDDSDEAFTCAVWGDNQQGAREGDWDADISLFARKIFAHLSANTNTAFGIATGDMATSAAYATQIKPLNLDLTDTLFGATRPYYVAWGNHDTLAPAVKPYFETGAADEPGYGSSDCGNYHLYRGNVLFVFIDYQLRDTAETVQWLTELLATPRARKAKFRVLVQHEPIFGETGNTRCEALLEVVKSGKVDLVLSGHAHVYERIEKDDFVQLTNGGLGCLDHHETVANDYGDATKVGGHNPLPYLWARQKSYEEPGVLGPAEPVRMGLIQGYGELAVSGNTLSYKAHGFNADGSYIGVFDTFAITSKTVEASAPAGAASAAGGVIAADSASFAEFTGKPVTNAKWKEYADAVSLAFTYPEGAGDCAVTGVSKTEINRFLAWLNGDTGDYRLPTAGELRSAFGDNLAREVSEWTSSVDPATGRCLILGGNTNAVEGTWCRKADRPMIMTADCSANYLGFRLATGEPPAEPADVFADALAQIAAMTTPAAAYRWRDDTLVDISAELANPAGDLAYDDPVILTGSGDLTIAAGGDIAFRGGLAAPNATSFTKAGEGALTVGGTLKGGPVTSSAGWTLASAGALVLANVSSDTTGLRFRSGDGRVSLVGENVCGAAAISVDAETANTFVAAEGAASLTARALRDYANQTVSIATNVTLTLSEDMKVGTTTLRVDGLADMAGFNVVGNLDPKIFGEGTLRTTYLGSCQNSYIQLAISNVILTSASPWRQNAPKYSATAEARKDRIQIAADGVRLAATCDWTLPPRDHFGIPHEFMAFTQWTSTPRVIFDTTDADDGVTPRTFVFSPLRTIYGTEPILGTWGFDVTGSGTLVVDCDYLATGACAVRGGTLRLAAGRSLQTAPLLVEEGGTLDLEGSNALGEVTFAGGTLSVADGTAFTGQFKGPLVLDEPEAARFTMSSDLTINGAITRSAATDKVRVHRLVGATSGEGFYDIFTASGLTENDVDVTHDGPAGTRLTVSEAGDVSLVVTEEASALATWVGKGDRANPNDSRNWRVVDANGQVVEGAVPGSTTLLVLRGETALNVPTGTTFAYGGFACGDSVTLADDCDWRGLGTVSLRSGCVLDLNGHTLALADVDGKGEAGSAQLTDLTADAEKPGELILDIPAGISRTNDSVRITGNLRVVKEGEGRFTSAMADQAYAGGTFVNAGAFVSFESLYNRPCGDYGRKIVVAKDAVFDRNGRSGLNIYKLVLDGGTLTCSYNPTITDHKGAMGDLEITDDSCITFDTSLIGHDNQGDADLTVVSNSVWNLNGHTLDIVFDGHDPDIYVEWGTKIRNGLVRTTMVEKGWFHDRGLDASEGGSFDLSTILRLNAGGTFSSVSNLTVRTGLNASGVTSEGYQKVYGTFLPISDYCYKLEFQDGATIDLSERTGAWSLTPKNGAAATAVFADNATIGIRPPAGACGLTKLVSWTAKPANIETLKFVRAKDSTGRGKIRLMDDGLYLEIKGVVLFVK